MENEEDVYDIFMRRFDGLPVLIATARGIEEAQRIADKVTQLEHGECLVVAAISQQNSTSIPFKISIE